MAFLSKACSRDSSQKDLLQKQKDLGVLGVSVFRRAWPIRGQLQGNKLMQRSGGIPLSERHSIECSRNLTHRSLITRCAATKSSAESDLVLAQIIGRRNEDGSPVERLVKREEAFTAPLIEEVHPSAQAIEDAQLLTNIQSILERRRQSGSEQVSVPGTRLVTDAKELDLIGRGLPIIRGPEFPDAYFLAIEQLSKGKEVPIPRPHPKFSLQDMERIAREGPRFNDLVLEHAESLDPLIDDTSSVSGLAQVYRYIPSGVVGDWQYEIEPKWQRLEAMPLLEFYQGLRKRNWTDKKRFDADSTPWRVQLLCPSLHLQARQVPRHQR
jgi:hypothetical protein